MWSLGRAPYRRHPCFGHGRGPQHPEPTNFRALRRLIAVANTFQVGAGLTFSGDTIHGGTIAVSDGVSLVVRGNSTLDGVTQRGVGRWEQLQRGEFDGD